MPEEIHKRLRIYCAETDSNMAETIRRIVIDFLDQQDKKKKK